MKNLKQLSFLLVVLLSLVLASCTGDQGPAGINGIDGENGAAGQDGNANIIASDWFDPTWTVPSTSASFTKDAPEITQGVLDSGVIMVYAHMHDHIYPLPISFIGDSIPKEYNFWADLGSVRIWFTAESSYTPFAGIRFRYVIIPSVASGSKGLGSREEVLAELVAAGVDVNDYDSVCNHFGLNLGD